MAQEEDKFEVAGLEVSPADVCRARLEALRLEAAELGDDPRGIVFRQAIRMHERQLSTMGEPLEAPGAVRHPCDGAMAGGPALSEVEMVRAREVVELRDQDAAAAAGERVGALDETGGAGGRPEALAAIDQMVEMVRELAKDTKPLPAYLTLRSDVGARDIAHALLELGGGRRVGAERLDAAAWLRQLVAALAEGDPEGSLGWREALLEAAAPIGNSRLFYGLGDDGFLVMTSAAAIAQVSCYGYDPEGRFIVDSGGNLWADGSAAAERRAACTSSSEWAELARRLREVGL